MAKVIAALARLSLAAESDPPRITTKKTDDSVQIRADKDKAVFVIRSPSGISQVVIERQEETWRKVVVLQLHFKGLESFRVSNGKVDGVVSLQEGKLKVREWKNGKEDAPLDSRSPFWMEIRILGGDGKPVRELPLKVGHFEVTLPRVVLEGNPKTITVRWIDFYRNRFTVGSRL